MEISYTCALSGATLLMAEELTRHEGDQQRRRKKSNVLECKRQMLRQAFPQETTKLSLEGDAVELLKGEWPKDKALTLAIDLAFTNPFAPYQLDFRPQDFWSALRKVGELVRLEGSDIDRIRSTQREAFQVHRHVAWGKIALFGIGGLIVLGMGGWLFAPAIGTAIGAAAGLTGAAATSHGLAILGGGSLAIGGLGMAGGMWVVTGTGAALGILGSGGATLLLQIGAAAARVELIKLQVNYKEVLLGTQVEAKKAQEVIRSLTQQRDEIRQKLEEECELNEKNSRRIKDIEATLEALEDSLKWMEKMRAQGNGGHSQSETKEREAAKQGEAA